MCVSKLECIQGILSEFGLRHEKKKKNQDQTENQEFSPPSIVYCDNRSTVQIANQNLSNSKRMKKFAIQYASIKEKQDAGVIDVKWISGLEQSADGLTKSLEKIKHQQFTSTFMGEC
jgi:hypothetical protein